MVQILWEWRFSEHGKINPEEGIEKTIIAIDQWEFWENVCLISLPSDSEDIQEIQHQDNDEDIPDLEFRDKIAAVVDVIINLWIADYSKTRKRHLFRRNFLQETIFLWEQMFQEATTLNDGWEYMEGALGQQYDEELKLNALWDILDGYRQVVFDVLVSNEEMKRS